MAYRYGNRKQMILFPQSVDDYIAADDPVRVYDAFIEALDFDQLGIVIDENQTGNPAYNPKAMLKLLVYGYSYGWRESRKLERAVHHNNSFVWLMGNLKPDYRTIARFREQNTTALENVLKQCARLCMKLNLISGNTLFVDGTKIRANASIEQSWSKKQCDEELAKVDERIKNILSECKAIDEKESQDGSLVEIPAELKDQETLKNKIKTILKELEEEPSKKSVNTTDPDCNRMKSRQGTHASYNAQIVVDEKHGLIVSSDVVNENNDLNQFAEQINQANETLETPCKEACADGGYTNYDELEKITGKNIKVIVPSRQQATKKDKRKLFSKDRFHYDDKNDCYICPENHLLKFSRINKEKKACLYEIENKQHCVNCKHYHVCTKAKGGRTIVRYFNEKYRDQLSKEYEHPDSKETFALRKEKAELPFGHIKRNLKATTFLLRGRDGVKAEMSMLSSCFNITRMITLLGSGTLIEKLMS